MQKSSNSAILTQLLFIFGFGFSVFLFILPRSFPIEEYGARNIGALEIIILTATTCAYLRYLFLRGNFSILSLQGILLFLLIVSGFHQQETIWAVIHGALYGVTCIVWFAHTLSIKRMTTV